VVTDLAGAENLVSEWRELFASSAERNAFLHPMWVLTWARHFLNERDFFIVVIRDGRRLVGVAPFRRDRIGWGAGPSVTRLVPMGSGPRIEFNELPAILTCSSSHRRVLAQVVEALLDHRDEWDWSDIPLSPRQGWFDPNWLQPDGEGPQGTLVHSQSRPCLVVPLASSWPDTLAGLKPHIRRSIRRAGILMDRTGHQPKFAIAGPAEIDTWVDTLTSLCRARARLPGKLRHADYLADRRLGRFLADAGRALAAEGAFLPCVLRVDGEDVAARLVLRSSDELYFSFSGFHPRWWAEGVATTLMVECLRWGIDHGCTRANLSVGVDNAKLRWSEDIEVHEGFTVVAPRRSARAAFALYSQIRLGMELSKPKPKPKPSSRSAVRDRPYGPWRWRSAQLTGPGASRLAERP
jgi:CelD/BcsL family acetyltransferase involved in cellulose biosynthesis